MMKLSCSDVPLWLRDSDFYRNITPDMVPDTEIEIPIEYFRETNDTIHTVEDVAAILKVMKYWGVQQIPDEVLLFCFDNIPSIWNYAFVEILGKGTAEHGAVKLAFKQPHLFSLEIALCTTRPEFVRFWLTKNDANSEHSQNAIAQACRFGRVDLVKTLRERGFKWTWDSNAYGAAAQYGHLHVLKYLHMSKCPLRTKNDAVVYAARGGQIDCMKYLRSIGCPWDENVTIEYSVKTHYVYLQSDPAKTPSQWTDDFSLSPPVNGYLECLHYALENGCPFHKLALNKAAEYGLVDCIELLRKHGMWDVNTSAAAASGGHIHCLKYLFENGCPANASVTTAAARHGHIECLMFLHEIDCPWDETATAAAMEGGHTECLHFLRTHGCP